MRAARAALAARASGVGSGACGSCATSRRRSSSRSPFLVGGVILHDAILAPVTVGWACWVRASCRATSAPRRHRFLLWGTLTLAFFNVLSGQGGKADNTTVLNRPYWLGWVILTVAIATVAIVLAYRPRAAEPDATSSHP